MRKLSFLITAIIAIVIFIIIGAPLLFGVELQKKYPEMVEHLSNSANYKLELTHYHRGWFSSTAQLKVSIYNQTADHQNPLQLKQQLLSQFVVAQTIYHGPIVLAKEQNSKKLYFARAIIENDVNQNNMELSGLSDWTYNNQLVSTITLPIFRITNNGQRVLVQNLSGKIHYALNSQKLKGIILANNIQVWVQNSSAQIAPFEKLFQIENTRIFFNNQKQNNGLWYGKTGLWVPAIRLFPNQVNPTEINGFKLIVNQNLIDSGKTNLNILSHADKAANTQFSFHDLNLSLNFGNLDSQALINFNKAMQENKSVYSQILELLAGGINVNVNPVSFVTEDGLVKLQANIDFPSQAQRTADPIFWLQAYRKLVARINMQFPQATVDKWMLNFYQKKLGNYAHAGLNLGGAVKQQVNYWLDKNIIKADGSNYLMQIDLKGGHLLINGDQPKTNNYFLNLNTLLNEQNNGEKTAASNQLLNAKNTVVAATETTIGKGKAIH